MARRTLVTLVNDLEYSKGAKPILSRGAALVKKEDAI
jgi:hypothetical protein